MKIFRCLRQSKSHASEKSATDKELQRKSSAIPKNFPEAVKILLLGTAESGKTTIIKQMRILHINGYTDDERRDNIPEIYQNIHESIYQLVQHMSILGLEYQSCASKHSAAYILSMGDTAPEYMNEEEFITILDTLEAEKNSLMEHNKTLNERIEQERLKNDNLQEQTTKQKIRIVRLESKIRDMERDIETNNEKKKRTQRIAEYASSLSAISSNTSLMSFTFENSSILNIPNCNNTDGDMGGEVANVTELRNRLELASEKIAMLREKLDYICAEKESDLKTFEEIINNTKNMIIETLLAQRASLSSLDIK